MHPASTARTSVRFCSAGQCSGRYLGGRGVCRAGSKRHGGAGSWRRGASRGIGSRCRQHTQNRHHGFVCFLRVQRALLLRGVPLAGLRARYLGLRLWYGTGWRKFQDRKKDKRRTARGDSQRRAARRSDGRQAWSHLVADRRLREQPRGLCGRRAVGASSKRRRTPGANFGFGTPRRPFRTEHPIRSI